MKEIAKNLAALVKVKTLVTLAVIAVFVTLALRGSLSSEVVMGVVTMVVAFYFGTQNERRTAKNTSQQEEPQIEEVTVTNPIGFSTSDEKDGE